VPGDQSEPLVRAGLRGFLDLDRFDVLAILVLVVVAFGLRFASPIYPNFLTGSGGIAADGVGYPYNGDPSACETVPVGPGGSDVKKCGYVFDEVYFPVDAAKDLHQPAESYFDPEPPLAKLLMTPPIAWWGFDTWTWRISTTFFGSLLVGVAYLIARRLRRDRFFAVATALFVCLDGLAFVESRTGVIDIIAIFFVALFYYVFLLHWQARTRTQWRTTLYVMAAVAGLAFGAKFTALAPLVVAAALIAARGLVPWLRTRIRLLRGIVAGSQAEATLWRKAAGRLAFAHYGGAALVALVIFFACYSRYLTVDHPDVYRFTSCDQAVSGLTGTPETLHVPVSHIGSVTVPNPFDAIHDIFENITAGLQYHEHECHSHPYASVWYTWPIMEHPVLFYYPTPSSSQVWSITDMGNPAVWWPAIPALLFCVWRLTSGPNAWRAGVAVLAVVSLVGMILIFQASQRFHDPAKFHTSYTAQQFTALFHRAPTSSEAIMPIHTPALFYVAFAGVILFAAAVVLSAVTSRRFVPAFIVLGYLTAWMMWVPGNAARVLFFYHALGMLVFAALALAYVLTMFRRLRIPIGTRAISFAPLAYVGVVAVVAGFVFFYPVWTAAGLSSADHAMRIWVDTP
jgi:4-amino-4-deoxy-L-arabinose transferase-like glycosyltransferase